MRANSVSRSSGDRRLIGLRVVEVLDLGKTVSGRVAAILAVALAHLYPDYRGDAAAIALEASGSRR